MIGASAGVSAIIFFLTFYNPNYKIRVFFFDLKLLYLAIFLFIYDIIQIPYGNAGGHIAHIGGSVWGYYFYKNLYNHNFIDNFFSFFETAKKINQRGIIPTINSIKIKLIPSLIKYQNLVMTVFLNKKKSISLRQERKNKYFNQYIKYL